LSLGRTLKETRIKRGISLSDVSRDLLIQEQYLEAIEDGIDGVIPTGTYKKIYTRAYCKFLGIEFRDDPKPTVLPKTNGIRADVPGNLSKEKEIPKSKAVEKRSLNPEPTDLEFPVDINKIVRITGKTLLLLAIIYIIVFLIVKLFQWIF